MKDLKELQKLLSNTVNHFTKLTFEATVDTGFENIAVEECIEKFGSKVAVSKTRGRIFFNSSFNSYEKLNNLRGVDHVNIIAGFTQLKFSNDKTQDLETIKASIAAFDWEKALQVWKESIQFDGVVFPSAEQHNLAAAKENANQTGENCHKHVYIREEAETEDHWSTNGNGFQKTALEEILDVAESSDEDKSETSSDKNVMVPKFRVTCHRVGGQHSFTSMDAAWVFGGELHDKYNWLIDLTNHNLEIILQIQENDVYVGLSLNRVSKHHRNITHFGPTTLRATVCYNMLRLCDPKPGDIVVDPLCGGGSIPIEGGLEFPGIYFIGGDIHEKAVNRFGNNLRDLPKELKVDGIWWDATNLPFKSNSVDIFVTDLPFGKRSGSKSNNKFLYKKLLNELARVARLETGKAVFLTFDKKCFNMAYGLTRSFWRQTRYLSINMGGLDAGCFVLQRTSEEFSIKLSKKERKKLAQLEWLRKKIERENLQSKLWYNFTFV